MTSILFHDAEIGIFWDLDACPVPENLTPALIYDSFRESLAYMYYTCKKMSVVAYSSTKQEENFESANIKLLQKADNRAKHSEIVRDVNLWAIDHRGKMSNLILICKISEQYLRYSSFKDLGINIFLAFPDDTLGCPWPWPIGIPSAVWLWSSLSTGRDPIDINQIRIPPVGTTLLLRDCTTEKKHLIFRTSKKQRGKSEVGTSKKQRGKSEVGTSSQVETTCSMTSIFHDAEIGIFWDLDACPVPEDLTPALIYDSFRESLTYMGYTCKKMSVVAYSSTKQEESFESANIKLLQKADNRAKHSEILRDVYLWSIGHRGKQSNLIVISKISEQYLRYSSFKDLGINIFLAFPDDTLGCPWPIGIPSAVWLWSSLSTGGDPIDINQIRIPPVGTTLLLRDCTTSKKQRGKSEVGTSKKQRGKSEVGTSKKQRGKSEVGTSSQVGTLALRACTTKQKQRGKKRKSL